MTAVFAHRGCTRGFVENSLEAFVEAIAPGADGVELDVRRTADGALVVHHDAVIQGLGAIGGPGSRPLADAPLLDEAIVVSTHLGQRRDQERSRGPRVGPGGSSRHGVVRSSRRGDLDRVIVSSFDVPTLEAVRQASDPL